MPRVSSIFKGSYLRAADLDGPMQVTISAWGEEVAWGADVYVLYLQQLQQTLRLGATLARDIADALGDDEIAHWPNHDIVLYPSTMTIKDRDTSENKVVDVIRARAAPNQDGNKSLAKAHPPKTSRGGPDDEVPF